MMIIPLSLQYPHLILFHTESPVSLGGRAKQLRCHEGQGAPLNEAN